MTKDEWSQTMPANSRKRCTANPETLDTAVPLLTNRTHFSDDSTIGIHDSLQEIV